MRRILAVHEIILMATVQQYFMIPIKTYMYVFMGLMKYCALYGQEVLRTKVYAR